MSDHILEDMIQTIKSLGPRPCSEFRANSKTIAMLGRELADRTPISQLPVLSLDGPPVIGSPEHFGMHGITIEVDPTLKDGQIKPAWPKTRFDFTSMRLPIDPTS
jgi:hypothetical protein